MDELRCPDCGESWMYLIEEGLVRIRVDGSIHNWTGELQCSECARVAALDELVGPPRLRLVT